MQAMETNLDIVPFVCLFQRIQHLVSAAIFVGTQQMNVCIFNSSASSKMSSSVAQWIRFAGFWWLTWFSPMELKPIPPPKTQTFTSSRPIQPQNVLLGRAPLCLIQDPLCDPVPSLAVPLSLFFYLGAVRAPLLKLLMKESIYNGVFLSPSLSPLKTLGTQHCAESHS